MNEFKEFAMRGNVLDMAVGIVIGAAFGKIVNSLVSDILLPPVGLLAGRVNLSNLFLSLNGRRYHTLEEARAAGAPTLNVGLFLDTILNFLIVAFAVFLLVRGVNRMKRRQADRPEAPPASKVCPFCLSTIPLKASRCAFCTSAVPAGRQEVASVDSGDP